MTFPNTGSRLATILDSEFLRTRGITVAPAVTPDLSLQQWQGSQLARALESEDSYSGYGASPAGPVDENAVLSSGFAERLAHALHLAAEEAREIPDAALTEQRVTAAS